MLNNFIYAKTKDLFLKELEAGNVSDEAIVFIEDTKEIWNHGTYFGNVNNPGVSSGKFINTTYSELKSLRDTSQLTPGLFYRITDYVTTTTQPNTKSANHPFDVIVLALSENTLCEDAKAILHEGDTYFAESDLNVWELKYCLDNDITRFVWADETNGKGVIYRMIDEKLNDCPYDFKNILFYNTTLTSDITSDKYYYTFSYVVSGVLYDGTTEKQVKYCYGNVVGEYRSSGVLQLNQNVFRNTSFNDYCYSNSFGNNCTYNSFGNNCYSNTFGGSCNENRFGDNCHNNTFGDNCDSNIFKGYSESNAFGNDCTHNTFGDNCSSNKFGNDCSSNTFMLNCNSNTFGVRCRSNTFNGNCHFNKFGAACTDNTFGSYCDYNTFGGDCKSNTFSDICQSNTFEDICNSNTFGNFCNFNKFGSQLQNRSLDTDKTSITLNEEFYDDGSGQLVPTKHPDLSTQPSILPYKFMGQYVYEQLIAPSPGDTSGTLKVELKVNNPFFLEAALVGTGILTNLEIYRYQDGEIHTNFSNEWFKGNRYIRLIYTSMPKDSSYYGY